MCKTLLTISSLTPHGHYTMKLHSEMLNDVEFALLGPKGAVTLANFSCNLSHNLQCSCAAARQVACNMLRVTPLHNAGKIPCSVARIVAKSKADFYFSQRLWQQKSGGSCSFQGMLHWAIFCAICLATKL